MTSTSFEGHSQKQILVIFREEMPVKCKMELCLWQTKRSTGHPTSEASSLCTQDGYPAVLCSLHLKFPWFQRLLLFDLFYLRCGFDVFLSKQKYRKGQRITKIGETQRNLAVFDNCSNYLFWVPRKAPD